MNLWERIEKKMRPKDINARQEKRLEILFFLVRLSILAVPLYLLMSIPGILAPLQSATTGMVEFILTSMGFEVARQGNLLSVPGFSFIIDEDCTGWKSVMFLFALVFSVKGREAKSRLLGFIAGSAAIVAFNLVRITGSVLAQAAWGTELALFLHDWVFRYALVMLVVGIWGIWLYLSRKTKNKS